MEKKIKSVKIDKKLLIKSVGFAGFKTILSEKSTHTVISYAITDQKNFLMSKYITEETNIHEQSDLLLQEFLEVCAQNYEIVFMHAGSRLDFTFILNFLSKDIKRYQIKALAKELTFYEIIITDKIFNKTFQLRDSYHMINMPIKEIGKYFSTLNKIEYNIEKVNLKNYMDLNIKKDVLLCNERDCNILKEGFLNFQQLIFSNFNVDIIKVLTIGSLSLRIFLSNFYENNVLYSINNDTDKFIRSSYFGGKTEVFKPYLKNGYHYDCNSLYSYVMTNFSYPIGVPQYVSGNEITEEIKNKKGFFRVGVSAPKNLKYPFLGCPPSFNSNTVNDLGLIFPTGDWIGVYFSEEINYAKELGYNFTYVDGYFYPEESYIFKNFVDTIYNMRLKYDKHSGLNKMCKLLLNSLYGKFGMKLESIETAVTLKNSEDYVKIFKNRRIISEIIVNNLHIITYHIKNSDKIEQEFYEKTISAYTYSKFKNEEEKLQSNMRANVALSSAIASYSRIFMDKVMRRVGFENVYYTDTDSIFSSVPIADDIVSDNILGCFKLEGIISEGIFIAPKMYSFKSEETNTEKVVMKGFAKGAYDHEDFKKHYFEGKKLKSEEENLFLRIFKDLQVKNTKSIKIHQNQFKKRKKIFDEKGQWVDTDPININKKNNEN